MRKTFSLLFSTLLLTVLCAGCAGTAGATDRLRVVATIFPEYDFARAIGGDRIELSMLTLPGTTVHAYDPAPSDLRGIQRAGIFLYIGGLSDVWVDGILASLDTAHMKIVRLIDTVNALQEEVKTGMEAEEEEEGVGYDEHIWTSPKNAIQLIEVIRDAFCEKDPQNAAFYRENAQVYRDALIQVDHDITGIVQNGVRRKIIVADRFPFLYFTRAYGLDYEAAFSGCNDQADAGLQTIYHLARSVEDEKIPYIYHVEMSNQSVARAVSEQTGAGMLLLHSCHNVSKADFESGVTYLDLMRKNAENLQKGLTG